MTQLLTRRELLGRAAAGGAAAFALPSILAACGGGEEGEAGGGGGGGKPAITISNRPLYIDIDEETKKRPTLQQFQEEFGVNVRYIEDINDNEEYFGKVQAPLSQGQSIDRDLMILTDWMAARMIRLGYVEKRDKSLTPNEANLVEALRHPGWDANRDYSLPWQARMTGIAYNPSLVGADVTSIDQLLTDPKLKGKITCLTEMPDTMGLVILSNGDDPSKVTPEAFDKAIAKLQAAVDSGQIRQFTGNDYAPLLAKGDVWACMGWSGDVVQLQLDNPDLRFVLPDSGGMIWTDNMLVPLQGNVELASQFMDFVYRPEVAAQIEAYVNYICPVEGAKEILIDQDPDIANNELIFPSPETLENVRIFDAEAADNTELKEKFQAVIGA